MGSFGECICKLNQYTDIGWECNINSWIRKIDGQPVWVIDLTMGPVCVRGSGNNLMAAAEQMLKLLSLTEKMALAM